MKRKNANTVFLLIIMCLQLVVTGCGSKTVPESTATDKIVETTNEETTMQDTTSINAIEAETTVSEDNMQIMTDYDNAEAFESALNAGENLEGKIVQFTVKEIHPDSKLGFNVWAGEHLNFVSTEDPGFKANDVVTVKVMNVKNILGSWVIDYEKAEDENMITSVESTEEDTGTYESNPYYDIVETASYKNSIGETMVIHKVVAKKNVSVSASVLAYAVDGSVIGKSEDKITLTEGENNYFKYSFESDISEADLQAQYSVQNDSILLGERNAVEMEQYNQSGNDLYITFKQVSDELGTFAKYKLLFYKGDTIVATEENYFSTSAKNMNGKDTSDVTSVRVYNLEYDRIEFIFEP